MDERRRFLRFHVSTDLEIRQPSPAARVVHLVNLGRGGIRVSTNTPPPPHGHMTLEFQLPGDTLPLTADAQVVWSAQRPAGGYHLGLQWTQIQPFDRARLLDFAYSEWLRTERTAGIA